jgi:hypothetical protein
MNARRHGLAIPLRDIPEQFEKLERLAAILSKGSGDLLLAEQSSIIAECHLELQRIRAVQRGLFQDIFEAKNWTTRNRRFPQLPRFLGTLVGQFPDVRRH